MSVRITLCLLVVLTCHRDISVLAGIGDACTPADCKDVNNATCVEGVCTCVTTYVPSGDEASCLPKAGYGEKCSESGQCEDLGEASCSFTCQCKPNFNYNGILCIGNVDLGQPCKSDYECFVPDDLKLETVLCHNSQCSCRDGYRRDANRCVIGGDCTDDVGCKDLGNSFCDKRVREKYYCACKGDFLPVANNTKCYPIATQIGSGCEYDEQCSSKLGNAVCTSKQCRCAEGAKQNDNNTCGTPGYCLTDDDCSQLENSYCDKHVQDNYQCACKDGFILVGNNTKCLPSAAVRIVLSLSCFVLVSMVKLL